MEAVGWRVLQYLRVRWQAGSWPAVASAAPVVTQPLDGIPVVARSFGARAADTAPDVAGHQRYGAEIGAGETAVD